MPRFLAFGLATVLIVGLLGARLFYLQVAKGGYSGALEQEGRVALQPVVSSRGLIVDRVGHALVTNVPAFVVRIRPGDLPFSLRPIVVGRLATLLRMPPAAINEKLDRNAGFRFDLVKIASDVPADVARVIAEERLDLPGVQVSIEARRQYPYGSLVAQLVGYTSGISGDEYRRLEGDGYLLDDDIGRQGVESSYETQLRGTYGLEQVERDASGRTLRSLASVQEPRAGNTLELSLDMDMQRQAEKSLRWAMDLAGIKRSVFVALNPQTGEVLAMASLPSYDNNLFARGISSADFQELLTDRQQPLLNHAISEQYPPGSTYKLVTGSGGLADGKIGPTSLLETRPFLSIGPYRYYEWNRRGWGALNIVDGFGHSSDTFFFQVAGMLGVDRLAYWARQFGFGAATRVDLPSEARGTVPSNDWKQRIFGQRIFAGETYQAGIGQGYDMATPLQVANAYAALANGGKLLQPQVVRRILAPDGTVVRELKPQLIRRLPLPPQVLRTMRLAARRVVTIRHTYNLIDLPIVVAGKSGTAEFGARDKQGRLPFHSWFAAFVPARPRVTAEDPGGYRAVGRTDSPLVVLAFMYDSRTKGNVATEVVKYFLQQHYGIKQDYRNLDLVKRANFYRGN